MNSLMSRYSVVLVAPQGGLNVGSVARAMANFGFSDLRLVTPEIDHLGDDARRMAVKAVSILENAGIYSDLPSALADCHLALGTTRRFGKYREDFLHPDDISEFTTPYIQQGRIALVFGREDSGLLTEELDQCQRFITIPTSDSLPSMNLAQAVSLCLYETAKGTIDLTAEGEGQQLASGEMLELMYQHMRKTLLNIGYLHPQNPDHILHAFRRIFGRALLHDRDVRIVRGMFRQIDWVDSERQGQFKGDDHE
jgi:tRNA/rRNA methyltransferase